MDSAKPAEAVKSSVLFAGRSDRVLDRPASAVGVNAIAATPPIRRESPEPRVLIVTGSTPDAEFWDRPAAYRLQSRVREVWARVAASEGTPMSAGVVLVCSDLWYLNSSEAAQLPTIAVGGPGTNALSAYLADKLPSAVVIDGRWIVQCDPEFDELLAACWGEDAAGTMAAVDAFADRYLEAFVEGAITGRT